MVLSNRDIFGGKLFTIDKECLLVEVIAFSLVPFPFIVMIASEIPLSLVTYMGCGWGLFHFVWLGYVYMRLRQGKIVNDPIQYIWSNSWSDAVCFYTLSIKDKMLYLWTSVPSVVDDWYIPFSHPLLKQDIWKMAILRMDGVKGVKGYFTIKENLKDLTIDSLVREVVRHASSGKGLLIMEDFDFNELKDRYKR